MAKKMNRAENSERAVRIEGYNKREYKEKILEAVKRTVIYGGRDRIPQEIDFDAPAKGGDCHISLASSDSVSEIIRQRTEHERSKIAVLNFADYYRPGGLFLSGSIAQEEALCHESILFNILNHRELAPYYRFNEGFKKDGLYTNRALYTPEVIFYRDHKEYLCDVITCAAPNFYRGRRYKAIAPEDNSRALDARIRFIRRIAEEQKVEVLILGAYGCGVFSQDPAEVSQKFQEVFKGTSIGHLVFALPGNNKNSRAFRSTFEGADELEALEKPVLKAEDVELDV